VQPNFGLDELFGAREKYVEFDPDLSDQLMFEVNGSQVFGRYFRQDYDLHGGKAAGQYANGNIAAVENSYSQGRTLLMGSFPGAGYYLHHGVSTRELFMSFLKIADLEPKLTIDDHAVQARLHQGAGGTILWATNPTRTVKKVTVTVASGAAGFKSARDLWGGQAIAHDGAQFTMSVPARDAVVALLQ
jgi:beta-galactosidase